MDNIDKVIVIGASAGGLRAVAELVSHISPDFNTAIFVVLHVSRNSMGKILVQHLQKNTTYTCVLAEDGLEINKGHLYIAPPDYHLIIKLGTMKVIKGPHENRWRPSIDVLFRSAAAAYDSRTVGIVLTGMLDDGTSGMSAIKRSGGICIVQEPAEAEFEDMPINVLNNVEVDYRVPIADMGYVLQDVFAKPNNTNANIPEDVIIEASITERMVSGMEDIQKIADRSNYTCPDCGGGLYKIKNDVVHRYRCFTGHVYTEKALLEKQSEGLEESLWISVRMLEERKNLLQMMAHHQQEVNQQSEADEKLHKADEIAVHIERLKQLMITLEKMGPEVSGFE